MLERRQRLNAIQTPKIMEILIYPFNCYLCQAFWVSLCVYLVTSDTRETWFLTPLMYAGLILLLSRVMPNGVTPNAARPQPGQARRGSCGG